MHQRFAGVASYNSAHFSFFTLHSGIPAGRAADHIEAARAVCDVTAGGTTVRGRRCSSTRAVLAEYALFLNRLGTQCSVSASLPDLVPASEWAAEVLRRERRETRGRPRHGSAPCGQRAPRGSPGSSSGPSSWPLPPRRAVPPPASPERGQSPRRRRRRHPGGGRRAVPPPASPERGQSPAPRRRRRRHSGGGRRAAQEARGRRRAREGRASPRSRSREGPSAPSAAAPSEAAPSAADPAPLGFAQAAVVVDLSPSSSAADYGVSAAEDESSSTESEQLTALAAAAAEMDARQGGPQPPAQHGLEPPAQHGLEPPAQLGLEPPGLGPQADAQPQGPPPPPAQQPPAVEPLPAGSAGTSPAGSSPQVISVEEESSGRAPSAAASSASPFASVSASGGTDLAAELARSVREAAELRAVLQEARGAVADQAQQLQQIAAAVQQQLREEDRPVPESPSLMGFSPESPSLMGFRLPRS